MEAEPARILAQGLVFQRLEADGETAHEPALSSCQAVSTRSLTGPAQ